MSVETAFHRLNHLVAAHPLDITNINAAGLLHNFAETENHRHPI